MTTQVADAPIQIVDYCTEWPALFEAEQNKLRTTLAAWLAGPIEHVGSTAVPGLSAKPIIDIMVAVESLECSREAIERLRKLDYQYAPYRTEAMHWFCKPNATFRTHHLQLIPYRSELWAQRIAFRDLLRSNPGVAYEYVALKKRLSALHRLDREAYTEAKGPFITDVLRRFRHH